MLIEILVSAVIVTGLLGAVFDLVDPADGALAVQSQLADLHQRQRAALGELHRDLLLAGSGPYPGVHPGGGPGCPPGPSAGATLARLRPAVAPYLRGAAGDRTPGPDRVSVLYAPPGTSGARLADPLAGRGAEVTVAAGPGCAALPCGLTTAGGGLAVVYAADGRSDLYRIAARRGDRITLDPVAPGPPPAYGPCAWIAPVRIRGYYHDRARAQLRVHNGAGADRPVIEGVVGVAVRYFGRETALPAGPPGIRAPCLTSGAPPPVTGPGDLALASLVDGPACGSAGAGFDVDLFEVRRIRVEVTLRGRDDAWRRPGGVLPTRPVRPGAVRDAAAVVEVAPRSLDGW